ncbi:ribonuclease H-like domain-containing protein [Tanacetum coccineum]
MENENPLRTLGDYSRPIHEGYRNTIELPDGNNVVPLRSDTIRLVQNGCSFYGLRSEDPNQHLTDFLKIVNLFPKHALVFKDLLQKVPHHGIDLWLQVQIFYDHVNPATRRTIDQSAGDVPSTSDRRLIELENQAINDRMTGALPSDTVKNPKLNGNHTSPVSSAHSYPMEDPQSSSRPLNLINVIKSCSKQTNNFQKDQPQVKTLTVNEIETPKPKQPEPTLEDEFKDLLINLPVLEVIAHAPIYNAILDKYVESLELRKNRSTFIQGEMPKKMKDPRLFTLPCRLGDSKPFDTLADLGSYGTKSYPVGIVKNVEVHIGKLKLLEDFYVIDMEKDPTTPLLIRRGFLATASAVIDCKKSKIAIGEGITSEDVVTFALEGLPDKYENVCGIITHRDPFLNLKMAHSMLTTEEMWLKYKSQSLPVDSSSSPPMVLMAESGTNHCSSTPQVKSWRPCYNFAKGSCRFGDTFKDFMTCRVLLRCDSAGDDPVTAPSLVPHAFLVSQHMWHKRLRQPGSEVLRRLVSNNFISCNKEKPLVLCHACQLGKHVRLPFVSSNTVVTSCFDIINSDVWTSPIPSLSSFKYQCDHGGELTTATYIASLQPMLFRHKYFAYSTLSRYKARLVENGSTQLKGIDVDETFSPVVKPGTIQTVLSLPLGFWDSVHPDYACLLQRSLYGLKQASRAWFQRFASYITRVRFHRSRCDSSLFIYKQGTYTAYLLLYVDNIILTASSETLLQQIIRMFLFQHKYDVEVLERAHMVNCNPSRTLVDIESEMGNDGDPILRYVRGTLDHGLQLFSSSTTSLVAYLDADWAGFPTTRSVEAEYRGVVNVVAETCWLRNLLHELYTPLSSATLVYCDNISTVYLSSNLVQHQRTKHIDIDIYFVRDLVAGGQVQVLHVISMQTFSLKDCLQHCLRSFVPF